jgi:hypothetical protein
MNNNHEKREGRERIFLNPIGAITLSSFSCLSWLKKVVFYAVKTFFLSGPQ